ncbi:CinA family protein [Microbacterium sulfonylureivorans]|uniref:CinA family protein n=1 Tax=Microbacterium sulfonylureivorans TaxID=2486854 RepID=UPI000FDBC660|nr:CinA family protein [Microbacterium sulfonylureivorans]
MRDDVERLARLCRARDVSVAVAESLTSGLLASAVGSGPEAGDWFCGGVVAYRTEVKVSLLGVARGVDPCSEACARQLARGARALLHADISVATTGVGGPDPEGGHEPGTVYLGWATADDDGALFLNLTGPPERVLARAVDESLVLLGDLAGRASSG